MRRLALTGARIYSPLEVIERGSVLVEDGRIAGVTPAADSPSGFEVLDLAGLSLAPGFIDVHVHGGGGHSLITEDADGIRAYSRWVTRFGVTGFLVTTVGVTPEHLERVVAAAVLALEEPEVAGPERGARPLGIHVEGPFISPRRLGAFRPEWVRPPDPAEVRRCLEAGRGHVRLMTLAPELDGAEAVVRELAAAGAVASLGHSDATYEEALRAFEWGIRHVTHCYNATRPFHQRDPGWLPAALTAPGITIELIADGVHVHPGALLMAARARGSESVVLVTDAVVPAGLSGLVEPAGPSSPRVEGGVVRLRNGTIAGGISTMDVCVRNAARWLGLPLGQVLAMASLNPARVAGRDAECGRIASGFRADLVALDARGDVAMTLVGGDVAYSRDTQPAG